MCCKAAICNLSFSPGRELSSHLWDYKEWTWERISSCCIWLQEIIYFAVFFLFFQSPVLFPALLCPVIFHIYILSPLQLWHLFPICYPLTLSLAFFPAFFSPPFPLFLFPSFTFSCFASVSMNGIHSIWFRTFSVTTWITHLVSIYSQKTRIRTFGAQFIYTILDISEWSASIHNSFPLFWLLLLTHTCNKLFSFTLIVLICQ